MSAKAYLKIIYDALKDMSECALILAMRDIRNNADSPWFPQPAAIIREAKWDNDHFNDMADAYLKGKSNDQCLPARP